jgi:integrase/recombinase XerD
MSGLRRSLEQYLTIRRALGFKLAGEGRLLANFVSFADQAGVHTLTTELALAWATFAGAGESGLVGEKAPCRARIRPLPADARPGHRDPARRAAARSQLSGDAVSVLRCRDRRLDGGRPAAYAAAAVGHLRDADRAARGDRTADRGGDAARPHRPRPGGAAPDRARLQVRQVARGVLLHQSTVAALASYGKRRDRLCRRPQAPSFFLSTRGTRLIHSTIYPTFRGLLGQAGLAQRSSSRRPRVHDLRHSFAVKTLLGWYRDGDDVSVRMPLLSTYLGHVDPAATYWYLSAAPELLTLAAKRLELAVGERS